VRNINLFNGKIFFLIVSRFKINLKNYKCFKTAKAIKDLHIINMLDLDDLIVEYHNHSPIIIIDDFNLISHNKLGSIIEAFIIKAKVFLPLANLVLFVGNNISEIDKKLLSDWIGNCTIIRFNIFILISLSIKIKIIHLKYLWIKAKMQIRKNQ
jgi:hypothetical protein